MAAARPPEPETRAQLRARMKAWRASLPAEERAERSRRIAERALALEELASARTILVYLTLRDEVDTAPLIAGARGRGMRIAAPRTLPSARALELRELLWDDSGEPRLVVGAYGIREPDPDRSPLVAPTGVDAVLLPGLAFDRAGNRLGYGAGYYDRFLAAYAPGARPLLAGLAFSGQVVARVPAEPWDVPIDLVVTEDEVIRTRPAGARSPRR